jgi:hypothetical protein
MSTYTAPVPTAQLRVPIPSGWSLSDACNRIKDIVTATPNVVATPAPSVLVDRAGTDNAILIVITFAPDGDTAGLVKNDILHAIDERMETPSQRQPVVLIAELKLEFKVIVVIHHTSGIGHYRIQKA